jgi:hypothetical protein
MIYSAVGAATASVMASETERQHERDVISKLSSEKQKEYYEEKKRKQMIRLKEREITAIEENTRALKNSKKSNGDFITGSLLGFFFGSSL